jgi:hypothetical protein
MIWQRCLQIDFFTKRISDRLTKIRRSQWAWWKLWSERWLVPLLHAAERFRYRGEGPSTERTTFFSSSPLTFTWRDWPVGTFLLLWQSLSRQLSSQRRGGGRPVFEPQLWSPSMCNGHRRLFLGNKETTRYCTTRELRLPRQWLWSIT